MFAEHSSHSSMTLRHLTNLVKNPLILARLHTCCYLIFSYFFSFCNVGVILFFLFFLIFSDFMCHVQHCVSHFAPLSPMKYGLCILFLLRSTSTQRLRPTRCFFRHLFLFSCIPCQAFWFFFAASFASFSFI